MNKVTRFFAMQLALLTGDNIKAVAIHNERKSSTAIKGQISTLEQKLVDDEDVVNDAKQSLLEALCPKEKIIDNKKYIDGIRNAEERLKYAQQVVKITKTSIEYWKEKQQYLNDIVEEPAEN